MKFCQSHWDALRQAITQQGLGDFISGSGQEALAREVRSLEGQEPTKEHFDPLMGAHWMIANRALKLIDGIGADPLMLMVNDPEHPEWQCPICCLNWLSADHDKTCTKPDCQKKKGQTFDNWIPSVAEHMKGVVEEMKSEPPKE